MIKPDCSQTQPSWSPDSNEIAFTNICGEDWTVCVLDLEHRHCRRLTDISEKSFGPAWSPDGKEIVFHSYRDGEHPSIYTMGIDGSRIRRLTDDPWGDLDSAWSPDGTHIAFTSIRHGYRDLYVMHPDGSNVRRISDPSGENRQPMWSPDSKHIAFGCADNSARAIEVKTGEQVFFQAAHTDWVFGTVYDTKGEHLISVGRDMTAKLTVFKTSRFIDNITSITLVMRRT